MNEWLESKTKKNPVPVVAFSCIAKHDSQSDPLQLTDDAMALTLSKQVVQCPATTAALKTSAHIVQFHEAIVKARRDHDLDRH